MIHREFGAIPTFLAKEREMVEMHGLRAAHPVMQPMHADKPHASVPIHELAQEVERRAAWRSLGTPGILGEMARREHGDERHASGIAGERGVKQKVTRSCLEMHRVIAFGGE